MINILKNYARNDNGITFLNYNDKFESRYDLFIDPTHVNVKGRELVTKDLIGDLIPLL